MTPSWGAGGSWWPKFGSRSSSADSALFADQTPKSSWWKWPFSSTAGNTPKKSDEDALALDTKPKKIDPELYLEVARAAERSGNYKEAIKQYQNALRADEKNVDILIAMAQCYDRAGAAEYASVTYEQAIKIQPKYAVAHNNLALFLARQGDMDAALDRMQKAIELDPKQPRYRNNAADILVKAGRHDEALAQLQAVHTPDAAHYNMGVLLQRCQQPTLARQHYEAAAQANPDSPPGKMSAAMLTKLDGAVDRASQMAAEGVRGAQETADEVVRVADDSVRQARQAAEAAAAQARGAANDAAQRVETSVYGAAKKAQGSIYGAVDQAQAAVDQRATQAREAVANRAEQARSAAFGKLDQLSRRANQAIDSYVPSGPPAGRTVERATREENVPESEEATEAPAAGASPTRLAPPG